MSACGCDTSGLKPVDEAIAELLARVPALPPVMRPTSNCLLATPCASLPARRCRRVPTPWWRRKTARSRRTACICLGLPQAPMCVGKAKR